MSASRVGDRKHVLKYLSKIESYVNDFNDCADTDGSYTCTYTMPNSKHIQYLMIGVLKDDHWRVFIEMMYDMIHTLANMPKEVATKMNAHTLQFQKVDNSEAAATNSKLPIKSHKQSQTRQSQKALDNGIKTNGCCLEDDKHAYRHTN